MTKRLIDFKTNQRKFVMVFSNEDYYFLTTEKEGKDLLSQSQLLCVPIDEGISFSGTNISSEVTPKFTEGNIYILSPFSSTTYMEISEARNRASIEKMALIAHLSLILGATSVNITRIEIIDEEKNSSISMNVEAAKVIEGKLHEKETDLRKLEQTLSISAELSGGLFKKEKLERFLKENNIDTDTDIKNIITLSSDPDNLPIKIRRTMSLTKSLENSFQYIASLGLPEILQKLQIPTIHAKAKLEQIVKEKTEIRSEIEILFPEKRTLST